MSHILNVVTHDDHYTFPDLNLDEVTVFVDEVRTLWLLNASDERQTYAVFATGTWESVYFSEVED